LALMALGPGRHPPVSPPVNTPSRSPSSMLTARPKLSVAPSLCPLTAPSSPSLPAPHQLKSPTLPVSPRLVNSSRVPALTLVRLTLTARPPLPVPQRLRKQAVWTILSLSLLPA